MRTRSSAHDTDHYAAVLVASSAGGVLGLGTLLRGLGADLPVPVLVAQHLRRARRTQIVEVLSRATALPVQLAEDGDHPKNGAVYLAPPDHHLCMREDGAFRLTDEKPINFARPAADPLFESAAHTYDGRVIACVLTGADSDGARGVEAVKDRGGTIVVQDPATAEFRGMPKSAIETGRVDHVLPLDGIGPAIARLLRAGSPDRR
ncbi:chemotaxis protein CheB [Streptomyces sp. CRN 30]|uniref:chemotaxis protein CheB n=1 Tax=Streptomyces sp. CRN 30 TaxID=3075613 RepID=UPI002A809016|nr:chemotaxis protein CheB [Streptomyces sp. CRN 30]